MAGQLTGDVRALLGAGLGACFLALLLLVLALGGLGRATGPEWAQRIDRYRTPDRERVSKARQSILLRRAIGVSERAVRLGGRGERVARDLDRAGLPLRPHEWLVLRVVVSIALGAVLAVFSGTAVVGVMLGAAVGWLMTRAYLSAKVRRRLTAFADQLPDALQLVGGSLRSGFTVAQALERLARQDIRPLGGEMARAVAETRIGASIEDALDKIAARMDCPDLSWVVMAIRIQREVGGNLADIIDTTVETMRERTRLRRHVQALSAEGRLTAYVLIALPLVVGGVMLLVRPDYMNPLFTHPIGVVLLVTGSVSLVIGWFWMSRVIKVET